VLSGRDIDELVAAIAGALERGEHPRAAALLGAEGRVFLDGHERIAAELGYARFLLAQGNTAGALRAIRAIPSSGRSGAR
jgi:hypothetical protein